MCVCVCVGGGVGLWRRIALAMPPALVASHHSILRVAQWAEGPKPGGAAVPAALTPSSPAEQRAEEALGRRRRLRRPVHLAQVHQHHPHVVLAATLDGQRAQLRSRLLRNMRTAAGPKGAT